MSRASSIAAVCVMQVMTSACGEESALSRRGCADACPRPLDAGPEPAESGDGYHPKPPVEHDAAPPLPCNGFSSLCDRSYDRVVFLGTHASMASGGSWFRPAQGRTIGQQLANGGVRALMLEVHASHDI